MIENRRLPRRTVLKGFGTAMALPLLEVMVPSAARAAAVAEAGPLRTAFFYVPNGAHMQDWTPQATGSEFALPYILEPLAPLKSELLVLSGLTLDKARANGDGGGDHARSLASFLTACQARKTDGANIRAGISVDQVAAQHVGHRTRFPSLELGCDRGSNSGNCDSGYSCAYSANISWRTPTTPSSKEVDPRLLFERLFAGSNLAEVAENRFKRQRYQQSILDFVLDDAQRLGSQLGAGDRRKLDEYISSVRDVERRITRVENTATKELPAIARPAGIPADYGEHIRLLADLLILAFQGDLTRVATYVFANEGSNRSYAAIGVPEGHHDLSHHGNDAAKQNKIREINRFHVTQFAYFLEKLRSTSEGSGKLLDSAMIVYGSGIGDGNAHNHDNLPILLCGRGGGTITPGRHIRYEAETPLANLHLSLLDRIESPIPKLGDSTGRLGDL